MATVTKTYLLAVVSIAIGASYQFFSFNIVNTTQTVVVGWINETYVARGGGRAVDGMVLTYLWSAVSSACLFGSIFGSLLTRPIAERLGRRRGLALTSMTAIIGGCICLLAKFVASPELLICGRFILGLNVGACCGLAPLYLTEISPVKYRGAAGTAHMVAVALGDLSSMIIGLPQFLGTPGLWPFAFAWPIVPAIFLLICIPYLPESPRYLLFAKNNLPHCRESLKKLVHKDAVEQEQAALIKEATYSHDENRRSLGEPVGWTDLFRRRWLRFPLLIALLAMVGQQFTGCVAIFNYSTDIFIQAGISTDSAKYCTVGIGLAYFFSVLPSPYFIERMGRRPLALIQLGGCLIGIVSLTAFSFVQASTSANWPAYVSIGSLVFYMTAYGAGSPVPWLIASELFSQEYRSTAVSISSMTSNLLAFTVSAFYLPFQRAVGVSWSFVPFIVILSFALVGITILLPETKNRTIEEIVCEFRQHRRTLSVALGVEDDAESRPLLTEKPSTPYGAYDASSSSNDVFTI